MRLVSPVLSGAAAAAVVLTLVACGSEDKPRDTDQSASGSTGPADALKESSAETTDFPNDLCDLLPLEKVQAVLGPAAAPDPERADDPEDAYPEACSYYQGGDVDLRTTVSLAGKGDGVSADWHKEHGTFVSDLAALGEGAYVTWTSSDKQWASAFAPAGVLKDPNDGQRLPMVFVVSTNVAPDGDKVAAVTQLATVLREAVGYGK